MWEKIKKFFKWIADHTGISWVARKISSGWKWLFGGKASATQQSTSQQEKSSGNERQQEPAQANDQSKDHTTPKTLDDEVNPDQPVPPKQPVSSNKPNFVQQNTKPGSYLEFTDNKLLFITTNENYKVLEEKCKNEDQKGKVIPGEFRVFVKCINDENFCITGSYDSQQDVSGGKKSVSITLIRKQNPQSLVSSNPSEMMYQVGLDENRKLVEITQISRKPFKTATLEQPNSNDNIFNQQSAGPSGLFQSNDKEPQPTTPNQLVNQDNIAGQDSSKIGETQNSPTTDLTTEQSTSSADKEEFFDAEGDGVAQPKSPAAPDEPQRPVINTSETDAKELPENFPTPNPKNADSDVLKGASNENYLKVGDKGLLLVLTSEQFAKCKDYKDSQSTSPGGLHLILNHFMYIKCGENEYCITGTNNDNLPNTICIKSILKKSKDGKYVNGNIVLVEEEIKHVKKMLESNNDGVVKVDSISNRAFEAPTLEQPNSNDNIFNQQSAGPSGLFQSNDKEPQPTTPNQLVNQDNIEGVTFVVIDSIQKYQPSAKPDSQAQGSGDEPNQSSFDNESVKDDDKEADNPQPEISANGSAPTDSSSFDIVSSQETTPDELQEPDEDKELARQSEADQKAPANDDGPNSLVATPEVQTASNDKTSNEL